MIDSLAKLLIANGLNPDSFTASATAETIFRGELPAGRVMSTWVNLARSAAETKYWPIIRGGAEDFYEQSDFDTDPASILAAAPVGSIREILMPRIEERRQSLAELVIGAAEATDLDELARLADSSGVYAFIGKKENIRPWPTEPPDPQRVSLHTITEQKGKPVVVQLIRVEHSSDVPAHLGFGGWNDCPSPELQVAALREWRKEYGAVPACITGDVLECVVTKRPQTEAEAMKLAAEQWIFCEDIVSQGTQSVRNLAIEIWRSPKWFFWWD